MLEKKGQLKMQKLMNKRIITHPMQEVAVDILTNMPYATKEWAKNILEYQRQIMDEKYGHHDGLE